MPRHFPHTALRTLCISLLVACGGGELVLDAPDPPPGAAPAPTVVAAHLPAPPASATGQPGPAVATPLCDAAHPYKCNGDYLGVCNPMNGGYDQIAVCPLKRCDAPKGRCDACFIGETSYDPERDPLLGCVDSHTRSICNADRDGFGTPEPCPDTAKDCVLGVCVGCKKDNDCPVTAKTPCSIGKCDAGSCTLVPGPKGKTVPAKSNFCDAVSCGADGDELHAYTPDATPVPGASATACTVVVCDGMGGERVDPKPAGLVVPLGPTTDCITTMCDGTGASIQVPAADGTPDPKAPSGECFTTVCLGGVATVAPSPGGTPLPATDACFSRQCDDVGGIAITNAAPGTACGDGVVCDGAGSCLPCTDTGSGLSCDDSVPCTDGDVPDAHGFFVAAFGDDASSGAEDAPFATIGAAIKAANASTETSAATIYVAKDVYKGAIAIAATTRPLTIDGGFVVAGGAWTRACAERAELTVSPKDAPGAPVVHVATPMPVTLRALRIVTKDASGATPVADQEGESVVGISFADGGGAVAHRLLDVEIVAQGAGPGGTGGPGQNGTLPSCEISVACDDGANGATGGDVPPGTPIEMFDASGDYTPASAPEGDPGAEGHRGAHGAGESALCWSLTCGVKGDGPFKACTAIKPPTVTTAVQGGGPCGCGGKGGLGGRGGHRGGASVGVVVASTDVSVLAVATHIVAGTGGKGGNGGPGGQPSLGSNGALGLTVWCMATTVCNKGECVDPEPKCGFDAFKNCTDDTHPVQLQGKQGLPGGTGGKGGKGADAAGGPSVAVAVRNGASWVATGSTILEVGKGGPGAGKAFAGPAADILAY